MNTDPKAYNLNNRVLLKRSGDNHLTIIINRKSRIIMKDGERIVKQKDMINKITVVDKIKNHNQVVIISGHINRSGESFLVGETPFKNKEQFPDMSNIYLNSTLKSISVHTVGQTRFSHETKLNKTTVWSESVGLLSPVFVYLGFFVQAYGVPERLAKKVKISEFLN